MKWIGETKYEIIDAVDGRDPALQSLYLHSTRRMSTDFIRYNFPRGALGCLLSHTKVVEQAIQESHTTILILEDDFLFSKTLAQEMEELMTHLPLDWEFVYLGKKQGGVSSEPPKHHWYPPNHHTWSSHAWLIRRSMFRPLLSCYRKLNKPVDLAVMDLFQRHRFCVVVKDIVITTLCSQIWIDSDTPSKSQPWNLLWTQNSGHYYQPSIRKIIVWGFTQNYHTHHYIHQMIYESFSRAYPDIPIEWVSDIPPIHDLTHCLIFASPCHGDTKNLPLTTQNFYIFHLDTFPDNMGISTEEFLQKEEVIALFTHHRAITLLCRQGIPGFNMKYFEKDLHKKMLCLPWGVSRNPSLKSPEECWKANVMNHYLLYQGSVWYVNKDVIQDLITACDHRNIPLILSGRIKEEIQQKDDPLLIVDNICEQDCKEDDYTTKFDGIRMWLPLQGAAHFDTYVSDRIFKSIQHGFIGLTNNPLAKSLFPSLLYQENIGDLIDDAEEIMKDRTRFCSRMRQQREEILDGVVCVRRMIRFLETCSNISIY